MNAEEFLKITEKSVDARKLNLKDIRKMIVDLTAAITDQES